MEAQRQKEPGQKAGHRVTIAGIGPGGFEELTQGAARAVREADVLAGAARMLAPYESSGKILMEDYRGEQLAAWLMEETKPRRAVVLVSGDSGFYSGAALAARALAAFEPEILPGISSLSSLCSRAGISWQDAHMLSAHGREVHICAHVRRYKKTFVLTDGNASLLLRQLCRFGMGDLPVWAGERLSYPQERVKQGAAKDLAKESWDRLTVLMILNEKASQSVCFGLPDEAFLRERVPMTKRPVRAVTLSALHPQPDSIVWDVGAGTGSVSIEAALAAWEGTVYAVEKNPQAAELIRKNALRFGTDNVKVVQGAAPEALAGLPLPDCVFVGGSGGRLGDILGQLQGRCRQEGRGFRLVLNAVSMQTIAEAVGLLGQPEFQNVEYLQLQASQTRAAGAHQLLQGLNPVFIVSGDFVPEEGMHGEDSL